MLNGKSVLVTGASGLIGSALVKRLIEEGARVTAMGRSREKLESVFAQQLLSGLLVCCEGNASDGIPEELSFDFIFHAASPISGNEIKSRPVDTISSNLDGAKNCLEFLKKQKDKTGRSGRLIIFSSATVYGTDHPDGMTACENDTDAADRLSAPAIAYSEAKRMTEVLAGAYFTQYGMDVVIVRLSYVYGYCDKMPETAFYEFIRKALNGEDIIINAAKMTRRDNIYIDDAVNGLICAVKNGESGQAYNISSGGKLGGYAAACELAEYIAKSASAHLNRDIRVIYSNGSCELLPGVVLECTKAEENIGYCVTASLEEGIDRIVEKYVLRMRITDER